MSALCQRPSRKDSKYILSIWSGQYLQVAQFSGGVSSESSHQQNSTWPRIMSTPPCSCGKVYKSETYQPWKERLEEHRKAVVRSEIEKSCMADHIWKEKRNHLPLWDEVKIIYRQEHWIIKRLKESAHMLSKPSIEMNTIWETIIKKVRKNRNMKSGKNHT